MQQICQTAVSWSGLAQSGCLRCVGGACSLKDVGYRYRPWPAPDSDKVSFLRRRLLPRKAIFEVPSRSAGPCRDLIGRLRDEHRRRKDEASSDAELGGAHFWANIRLIELRAGHGRSPRSTSYGYPHELPPRHVQVFGLECGRDDVALVRPQRRRFGRNRPNLVDIGLGLPHLFRNLGPHRPSWPGLYHVWADLDRCCRFPPIWGWDQPTFARN